LQSVLLFIDFVWTGEGANFGEGMDAIGGGVDNGRLEGVLPAAAFFSTWMHHKYDLKSQSILPKKLKPLQEEDYKPEQAHL
jgi:hypothetical protein